MSEDQARDERIQNEIIVDCYGDYEIAAGWHCYLEDHLTFPFKARCSTEGCAWFAIRPNAELYLQLLQGATSVVNPSTCRDGVVALLQVKSPVEVAVDIHNRLDIDAPDPHNSAIISMFYWLGYMPKALTRNNAWPGYAVKTHLWILDDYSLIASGITTAPLTPASDPARVDLVSRRVITTMLDLFENNSSNQTARGIIALLAPRLGYPDDLLPRIKSIYELAKKSTDDYVRHRVRQYKV
jgi:hypothetical protein